MIFLMLLITPKQKNYGYLVMDIEEALEQGIESLFIRN